MRNTSCTPDVIKLISDNISLGLNNKDAAQISGISQASFYSWINRGQAELDRVAENPSRRRIKEQEAPFVEFLESVKVAISKRKQLLLGRILRAANGGDSLKETKRIYKRVKVIDERGQETYDNILVEEITTEKQQRADWTASAWLLERGYPDEFGRRARIDHHHWTKKLKEIWDTGTLTIEDVIDELGNDLAREFFESAGINYLGFGSFEEQSQEAEDPAEIEAGDLAG